MIIRALALFLGAALSLTAAGCERGDWLGPAERGIRALVHGWDMWDTPAVRPFEAPMPPRVEGTVPVSQASWSFEAARRALDRIPAARRPVRAAQAYRRYCHHCHGASGDGRSIVGESFSIRPPDLRAKELPMEREDLFDYLREGGGDMLPLGSTLSPVEVLLTIEHMRRLADRPSRPVYPPQSDRPLQHPPHN